MVSGYRPRWFVGGVERVGIDMKDIIERVATGTTTVKDADELERVFEGVGMKDIIERVATGMTTVEDAHELGKALAKANVV